MVELVGLACATPVLRPGQGAALQTSIEVEGLDHLRGVHGHVAVFVKRPGVVGHGHLFKDLVGVVLAGVGAQRQSIQQVALAWQGIASGVDVIPGDGRVQASVVKGVATVPDGLDPAVERDGGVVAGGRVGDHLQRAAAKVILAYGLDHGRGSILIQDAIGGKGSYPLDAHADEIRRPVGGQCRGNALGDLRFIDGQDPYVDVRILSHEPGSDLLIHVHPLGLIVSAPELDDRLFARLYFHLDGFDNGDLFDNGHLFDDRLFYLDLDGLDDGHLFDDRLFHLYGLDDGLRLGRGAAGGDQQRQHDYD